jgi:hypothetical protein
MTHFNFIVNGLEEGEQYIFEVEDQNGGPRVQKVADITGGRVSSARLLVLSVLVCIILMVAVAIASWHLGKSCGNKEQDAAVDNLHADPKSKHFDNY